MKYVQRDFTVGQRMLNVSSPVIDGQLSGYGGSINQSSTNPDTGEITEAMALALSEREFEWAKTALNYTNKFLKNKNGKYIGDFQLGNLSLTVTSSDVEIREDKISRMFFLRSLDADENVKDHWLALTLNKRISRSNRAITEYFLNVDGNPTSLYSNQQIFSIGMGLKVLTLPMMSAVALLWHMGENWNIPKRGWSELTLKNTKEGAFSLHNIDTDFYSAKLGEKGRSFVTAFLAFLVTTPINMGTLSQPKMMRYGKAMNEINGLGASHSQSYRAEVFEGKEGSVESICLSKSVGVGRDLKVTIYCKEKERIAKSKSKSEIVAADTTRDSLRFSCTFEKEGLKKLIRTKGSYPTVKRLYEYVNEIGTEKFLENVASQVMDEFGVEHFLLSDWALPGSEKWEKYLESETDKRRSMLEAWEAGVPWRSRKIDAFISGGKAHRNNERERIKEALGIDLKYPLSMHQVAEQARTLIVETPELQRLRNAVPLDDNDPNFEKAALAFQRALNSGKRKYKKNLKDIEALWKRQTKAEIIRDLTQNRQLELDASMQPSIRSLLSLAVVRD